jgi:hypothetical protein
MKHLPQKNNGTPHNGSVRLLHLFRAVAAGKQPLQRLAAKTQRASQQRSKHYKIN